MRLRFAARYRAAVSVVLQPLLFDIGVPCILRIEQELSQFLLALLQLILVVDPDRPAAVSFIGFGFDALRQQMVDKPFGVCFVGDLAGLSHALSLLAWNPQSGDAIAGFTLCECDLSGW